MQQSTNDGDTEKPQDALAEASIEPVVTADRRLCLRVAVPIDYRLNHSDTTQQRIVDISLGGIRLHTCELCTVGQEIEIELFLPNKRTLICMTRVVWVAQLSSEAAALYDMGLQFVNLSTDDFLVLAHQIKRHSLRSM